MDKPILDPLEVVVPKRKRTTTTTDDSGKKKRATADEDKKVKVVGSKKKAVEEEGLPPKIYLNLNQPSTMGKTWGIVFAQNKQEAMDDLRKELDHYDIELTTKTEDEYRLLRIKPEKGKSIIIVGDLV